MKLFYSPGSPYARIARIALRESGLAGEVSEILAANRRPDNPALEFSAVGRVPTLIDGDFTITETRHVFDYLASKCISAAMRQPEHLSWREIGQEGQILGFLEGISSWVRENRGEPQARSDFLIGVEVERSNRCLAYLENEAGEKRLPDFPMYRSLALAAALGLMEFQQLRPDWRTIHPRLTAWYDHQAIRTSMKDTAPA
ncbi:glutathione S-transferase family protein [Rhizobium calliandrae]|uniref:Glutathione S-transferase family protein n=1 Tax=Rhizobium calliandrae TaxID=1312182 RepID=A0ABT7KNM8_9HYPH|nr:glutathione S-transferase family protein [Rhizobium calliandrae]MDL2410233.1 glutathione S-transferase family protein [Rhizobium calliandrae]